MNRVLLDANVIVTYLTKREDPYLHDCEDIIRLRAEGKIEGFISLHSLSIVWYLLRKYPEISRLDCITQICEILEMATPDMKMIRNTLRTGRFADFEDLLQDCSAQSVHADYLVTANLKDFKNSVIPAIIPSQLVQVANSMFYPSLFECKTSPKRHVRKRAETSDMHGHIILKGFSSSHFHACLVMDDCCQLSVLYDKPLTTNH